MSGIKKNGRTSLHSFFKPITQNQPASSPSIEVPENPTIPSSPASPPATFKAPASFPHPAFGASRPSSGSGPNVKPSFNQTSKPVQQIYTSSLSPPSSSSDISDAPRSMPTRAVQPTPASTRITSDREVKGSDDEDDSDASLEDLSSLFRSSSGPKTYTPSTPIPSKPTRSARVHVSPLVALPKYKFDMAALARHAKKDNATEASSKRVKAMAAPAENSGSNNLANATTMSRTAHHNELLESVVTETEGGEMQKISRALDRTEATLPEFRWYFFEATPSKPERSPFPVKSITANWRDDLKDSQSRYQAFVSGFAEDMVGLGKSLPDEIFMWMIDELCSESSEVLRTSYCNVLRASSDQVNRLVAADVIQNMFRGLGGTLTAVTVSQIMQPVKEIVKPYEIQDWAKLRSVVKFLGQASNSLQLEARILVMCIMLRMGVDRVVSDNIDLYDLVQETIFRLCRHVSGESWETLCQEVCQTMFKSVLKSTFRLQIVETLPSTSTRAHDLRRRLAMCFCFNDLSYSTKHSHHTMDLNLFINRLTDEAFEAKPETDYRELAALTLLLDVAVDDARSVGLDLADRKTEDQFDLDVEVFAGAVKNIMKSIGTPGPGLISKIEAKEMLELVSQRIGDTLRSRPKAKQTLFEAPRNKEDLKAEKNAMDRFLSRNGTRHAKSASTPPAEAPKTM